MTQYQRPIHSFGRNLTRMFCPECKELREVRATGNEYSTPRAWLNCGHVRVNELETR